jgi:hypothetical protein
MIVERGDVFWIPLFMEQIFAGMKYLQIFTKNRG